MSKDSAKICIQDETNELRIEIVSFDFNVKFTTSQFVFFLHNIIYIFLIALCANISHSILCDTFASCFIYQLREFALQPNDWKVGIVWRAPTAPDSYTQEFIDWVWVGNSFLELLHKGSRAVG